MESVSHSVRKFSSNSFADWLSSAQVLSSVSCSNLIAFTCFSNYEDQHPKVFSVNVYVCDLNSLSDVKKVFCHTEDITCLEWDFTGTKLLVGDSIGKIQVWQVQKDITKWTLLSSHDAFKGEKTLAAVWFHSGNRVIIQSDKKNSSSYQEKFSEIKGKPPLKQFGGKPYDGCLAISSTGLLWTLVHMPDDSTLTAKQVLGPSRTMCRAADIHRTKSGQFNIAVSSGSTESAITCYKVNVNITGFLIAQGIKCEIECEAHSNFRLKSTGNPNDDPSAVTILKYALKEDNDSLIVGIECPNGSIVELWESNENSANNVEGSESTSNTWKHKALQNYTCSIDAIVTPHFSPVDTISTPCIVVANSDDTIKCLSRDNLQQISSATLLHLKHDTKAFNQQKATIPLSIRVTDMQFTASGCAFTVIDSISQIQVFRLDFDSSSSLTNLQALFEYCLLTGNDWSDLLMHTTPSVIESLLEKLKEAFSSQPQFAQQKYLNRFNKIYSSLHKSIGQSKSVRQYEPGHRMEIG
ncbi:Mediator of RNA polymerase II transcription subunit 16 [Halotydeus destructor]|nr:Mediator of RNA polymerase II transcription subunit 16 [Halotydeus destructor]